MNWAAIGWLITMVLFLMIEASSVALISIWFAVGAVAAAVTGLLDGSFLLQLTVFLVVSAVLLLLLRPLVRKYVRPKITATNVASVIGSTGLVTAAIDNVVPTGQVKLGAMVWTARSSSGDPIPQGTLVRADRIEGVKVFVSPVRQD